jgi:hypothetical protein
VAVNQFPPPPAVRADASSDDIQALLRDLTPPKLPTEHNPVKRPDGGIFATRIKQRTRGELAGQRRHGPLVANNRRAYPSQNAFALSKTPLMA